MIETFPININDMVFVMTVTNQGDESVVFDIDIFVGKVSWLEISRYFILHIIQNIFFTLALTLGKIGVIFFFKKEKNN